MEGHGRGNRGDHETHLVTTDHWVGCMPDHAQGTHGDGPVTRDELVVSTGLRYTLMETRQHVEHHVSAMDLVHFADVVSSLAGRLYHLQDDPPSIPALRP